MEQNNRKFFRKLTAILLCSLFATNLFAADSEFDDTKLQDFRVPKFNEQTKKLEYILNGTTAISVGGFIRITDARLSLMSPNGTDIQALITTPEAFYNMVTGFIRGDKDVHYRSLKMDMDGVGFEGNQMNDSLKINKEVKVLIYQDDDPTRHLTDGKKSKEDFPADKTKEEDNKKIVVDS